MRKSVLSYKMPELGGPTSGIFSKIPHHELSHDKRYYDTSYKNYLQKQFDDQGFKPLDTKMISGDLNAYAGNCTGFKKIDKIKITTKLISERYNIENEPKFNSIVQRTWNYHKDAAIVTVEDLGIDNRNNVQLPPIDNELSLPLGNGSTFEKLRSRSVVGWKKTFADVTKKTVKVSNLRKY